MTKKELEQFMVQPDSASDIPDLMLFADVDYVDATHGRVEFRAVERMVREGLRYASQICDDLAADFIMAGSETVR